MQKQKLDKSLSVEKFPSLEKRTKKYSCYEEQKLNDLDGLIKKNINKKYQKNSNVNLRPPKPEKYYRVNQEITKGKDLEMIKIIARQKNALVEEQESLKKKQTKAKLTPIDIQQLGIKKRRKLSVVSNNNYVQENLTLKMQHQKKAKNGSNFSKNNNCRPQNERKNEICQSINSNNDFNNQKKGKIAKIEGQIFKINNKHQNEENGSAILCRKGLRIKPVKYILNTSRKIGDNQLNMEKNFTNRQQNEKFKKKNKQQTKEPITIELDQIISQQNLSSKFQKHNKQNIPYSQIHKKNQDQEKKNSIKPSKNYCKVIPIRWDKGKNTNQNFLQEIQIKQTQQIQIQNLEGIEKWSISSQIAISNIFVKDDLTPMESLQYIWENI